MAEANGSAPSLIQGDRFSGLSIADLSDQVYDFALDGQKVQVRQTWTKKAAGLGLLDLEFNVTAPVRFRVDVLVPADCRNACVTLNDQMLIGWFAAEIPDDLPAIITSHCQDENTPVSTLRPGQFQSVNFRWLNQDHLRFCLAW